MNLIITLLVIILVSAVATIASKKTRIPLVPALIFTGIILSIQPISSIVISTNKEFVLRIGDFGLIALMFLAGLEISISKITKGEKDAAYISVLAAIVPMILGFIIFYLFGFDFATSAIIAICLSITAEGANAKVLIDLKKLKTKIGSVIMGAGLVDDIIGLALFIFITYAVGKLNITDLILLSGGIFAFFVGIIVQKVFGRNHNAIKYVEQTLIYLIIPFFFVSIGLTLELHKNIVNPTLIFLVLGVAIFGKLLGTFAAKRFTKLTGKQILLVGWSMNSRGAVELALALVAYNIHIIDQEIYFALITMAIVTTILSSTILSKTIEKNPKIMTK